MAPTIAIIDDDIQAAEAVRYTVEDAGFNPWIFTGKSETMGKTVQKVKQNAQGAVCDHRLSRLGFATFNGAELAARLIHCKIPAVLVSQFFEQDYDVSIRHWRAKLPSVLRRDELRPETFAVALKTCKKEIEGDLTPQRRPHRVLFKIVDIQREANQPVVDVIIPSWSRGTVVRFPMAIVPSRLHLRLKINNYLIADVNLGANRPEDLFFDRFEKAPTPKDALFNCI